MVASLGSSPPRGLFTIGHRQALAGQIAGGMDITLRFNPFHWGAGRVHFSSPLESKLAAPPASALLAKVLDTSRAVRPVSSATPMRLGSLR